MRKEKKRTSSYDANRQCYMASDATAYFYERWNSEIEQYERIPLTVGKDGITQEIILLLDSMDHDEDLGNRYARENTDPLFDARRNRYEADPDGDDAVDPWDTVSRPEDDPANVVCGQEVPENPDIARVREVIETKCNERQRNLFFAHFGECKQLEEIRKEEVEISGKEKKLQAIVNVKNDVIGKVADAFGVTPVKRRRTKKG